MLVICGTITAPPDKVADFYADISKVAELARSVKGCLDYLVGMQDAKRGQVLLVERWTDQQSLDTHLADEAVHSVLAKWGPQLTIDAKKYDASNERSPM